MALDRHILGIDSHGFLAPGGLQASDRPRGPVLQDHNSGYASGEHTWTYTCGLYTMHIQTCLSMHSVFAYAPARMKSVTFDFKLRGCLYFHRCIKRAFITCMCMDVPYIISLKLHNWTVRMQASQLYQTNTSLFCNIPCTATSIYSHT